MALHSHRGMRRRSCLKGRKRGYQQWTGVLLSLSCVHWKQIWKSYTADMLSDDYRYGGLSEDDNWDGTHNENDAKGSSAFLPNPDKKKAMWGNPVLLPSGSCSALTDIESLCLIGVVVVLHVCPLSSPWPPGQAVAACQRAFGHGAKVRRRWRGSLELDGIRWN